MKIKVFIISLILTLTGAILSYSFTPEEILKKVDEIRAPGRTFVFNLKVIVKKGDSQSEAGFLVRVKDAKKSLVLYKSPPSNRGRVLLMVEDNLWIYIPGTRRPLRISPNQQLMGRVSNADVARVVYSLDYKPVSLEDDNINGRKVLRMSLSAKTKGAAYKNINLWIEKDTFRPIKAEFFALSSRLIKTVYYKGYKEVLGKKRPIILEIHDAIKESEVSIMEYSNFRLDDTPDIYFQKTFMERVR